MNGRRGFIKGFGLLGAVVGGLSTARTANAVSMVGGTVHDNTPSSVANEDISHLAPPEQAPPISITGSYGEPVKPEREYKVGESVYFLNGYERTVTNQVHMAVGKDDRLWMKIGDQWKRVAIE